MPPVIKFLPRNLISRWVGDLAASKCPTEVHRLAIKLFVKKYGIDLSEVEYPLESYKTLDAFFTRRLRPDTRPIDSGRDIIVSPVDGVIQERGRVENGRLIQAKGIDYPLEKLIPTEMAQKFTGGDFETFYLSPRDCHLIFSPVDGVVRGFCHVPGKLFPVRDPYVSRLKGLYTLNERLITYMECSRGMAAIVKVGAYNVGRITAAYDPSLTTNDGTLKIRETFYDRKIVIKKGEPLGAFHFGSTVILIFQKGMVEWEGGKGDKKVKYGQKIGIFS